MDGGIRAGGSRALASLIEGNESVVFSDLLREYGVHLGGVVADPPTLSPSEALALIENLPEDSRTLALLRGMEDSYGWTVDTYLTAALIDAVRENTYANMQVRTKKSLPKPEKLPVPGVERKKKVNSFVAMAQAQLAKAGRL